MVGNKTTGTWWKKHSHITCDISANDLNHHFANIGNKMNSKFQTLDDNFSGEAQKSIHSFRLKRMYNANIVAYLGSLPNRSNNDKLGMDIVFFKESARYIYISLANVINKSLKLGVLSRTGRMPEWRLSIRMMATLITKMIIIQYVIGHIVKMIESLVSYQIIDFWKSIVLFQWTDLLIWKDTQHKLAFIIF